MTADKAYGPAVESVVREHPELAGTREALRDPKSPIKLVAVKCEGGGSLSLLQVVSFSRSRMHDWDFGKFQAGALRAMREGAVPGTSPHLQSFWTPAGRAVRIRVLTKVPNSDLQLATSTYLIQTPTDAFMVQYMTSTPLADVYADLFDRSARSLRSSQT